MGDIIKITLNLTVICALAGIILSAAWAKTDPVRIMMEAKEREEALKNLIPSAESITPVKDVVIDGNEAKIYQAVKGGETIGYVVACPAKGYSSFISMLVAVDKEHKVIGIDILSHAETPGLGDQITDSWFKEQFKGKGVDNLVVIKGETDSNIQAISGATISSRAVTKGTKDAVDTLVQGGL